MKYPSMIDTYKRKELTVTFGGLNQNLSCKEGQFVDMKNMTADDFPILSTRKKRRIQKPSSDGSYISSVCKTMDAYIKSDDNYGNMLFINSVYKPMDGITISRASNTMVSMGAYLVIFPDKIWYNTKDDTYGYIEASKNIASGTSIKFEVMNGDKEAITWHTESYYKDHTPEDGDYMMITKDGKSSLRVFYKALSMWSSVATTYIKITSKNIGKNFEEDDGLKITIDNSTAKWSYADKVFVNKEDDGRLSINTYIVKKDDDYILIPGILKENKTFTNMPMEVIRKCPDMDFIIECQNRIWGCNSEKHEIYCSKLGDPKNFNYFKGISLDSWAATVGSGERFTGAVTYNQNPIFFKEDKMIKVSVSASGAHSYREYEYQGVGYGNNGSIAVIDSVIYYHRKDGVYAYDGSIPIKVSDDIDSTDERNFGVAGALRHKYLLSVSNATKRKYEFFVYDTKKGIWTKEDNIRPNIIKPSSQGALMYVDNQTIFIEDYSNYSLITTESDFDWFVESGNIGCEQSEHKFITQLNLRMMLSFGAYADVYIQYDSSGTWEHLYNISGKGTSSFNVPMRTRRCDHFRYKISGRGDCKIYSINKVIEEGSDY